MNDDDDRTLFFGIGQNITHHEVPQEPYRLMISVLDITNASNPQVVASTTLKEEYDGHRYTVVEVASSAQREAKSVTFADEKLVIPITYALCIIFVMIITLKDFWILDIGSSVNTGNIIKLFRVFHGLDLEHLDLDNSECHSSSAGYFETQRSFFYDDTIMTVDERFAISTSLTSGEQEWLIDNTPTVDGKKCCRR